MSRQEHAKTGAFTEKAEAPIAGRYMTMEELEEYRLLLARSYKIEEKYISFKIELIPDALDSADFVNAVYYMSVTKDGVHKDRCIHTLKMPVPDGVREAVQKKREKEAREGTGRQRRTNRVRALPST